MSKFIVLLGCAHSVTHNRIVVKQGETLPQAGLRYAVKLCN